jgi:hypothetical protein
MRVDKPRLRGSILRTDEHLIETMGDAEEALRSPPPGVTRLELWGARHTLAGEPPWPEPWLLPDAEAARVTSDAFPVAADLADRLAWDWMRPFNNLPASLTPPVPSTELGSGMWVFYRARWTNFGEPVSDWSEIIALPLVAVRSH